MKNLDFTYEIKRQLATMNLLVLGDMSPRGRLWPKFSRTYKPNGQRECARRMRQMAKGKHNG